MPSRADARSRMEGLLQGAAMAILALLALRTFAPPRNEDTSVSELPAALQRITRGEAASVMLRVDSLPGVVERESLRAVHDAGVATQWTEADSIPAIAVVVEPTGDPLAPARTTVMAPTGAALRDTVGEVWRADSSGAAVLEGVAAGGWRLVADRGVAVPNVPSSEATRRVRVIGPVGWEARFISLALVEAGWEVESDYTVTPGADAVRVRTGGVTEPLDTATHAAVVVVGGGAASSPSLPRELVGWVRSGGGVVLAGAPAVPALDAIAPGRAGARMPGSLGGVNSATPRDGLDALRLTPRSDAVVLEQRRGAPTVVARREGLGRVISVGYLDSWHWRMEGGDASPAAHAAWWSGIVASATRAPSFAGGSLVADPAPLAALHAALGPPVSSGGRAPLPRLNDRWLLAMAFALLLATWASRRTRGLP